MSSKVPTLAELMQRSAAALMDGMHVTLPAVVERYDAARQCVDAQPTIKRERLGEDGATVADSLPVVLNAPVVFPGSGPYRMTFPIEVGSVVILHFTSAAMDRWLALGGKDVEPRDGRRHDLASAFAVPGGHSLAGSTAASTTAPEDALVVHAPTGGLVRVGGPAAATPPSLASEMAALKAAFAAFVPASADGTSIKTIFTDWSAPGATKVRVE